MKHTVFIMNMPITIEISDDHVAKSMIQRAFEYFRSVDSQFSVFKESSEISRFNRKELTYDTLSHDMKEVLAYGELAARKSMGYFTMHHHAILDPTGIVKGWAIDRVAKMFLESGIFNFYINAGGDIYVSGINHQHAPWRVGIRNPFQKHEIVKALSLTNCGIATSGTYERGNHIVDPHDRFRNTFDIVSLTVIAPTTTEADCMATAAFAMGNSGIQFIQSQQNLEGYCIDIHGIATYTSGFSTYVQ